MLLNKIAGGVAALAVSLPLLVHAAERPDGKPFEVGVRVGAQISNLLTDAKWGPYPDISGPGGMLSADFSRGFSDNFYLHAALGLDLRTYYTHIEMSIPCEGDCGGAWDGDEIFSYLYLEIPVMAQWRNSVLFVEAGPVFDAREVSRPERWLLRRQTLRCGCRRGYRSCVRVRPFGRCARVAAVDGRGVRRREMPHDAFRGSRNES